MKNCYYEKLHEFSLFDTPYKIHMKGFINLNGNDFLYLLYTHGNVYGLFPEPYVERLMIFENEEIEQLINKSKLLNCYKYEKELIIKKDSKIFDSNLFKLEDVGNPPFEETFFVPIYEMEYMVVNKLEDNKENFLKEIYSLMPNKSLDEIIKSKKPTNGKKEIKETIDKDYR